jgi:hypothetical protein
MQGRAMIEDPDDVFHIASFAFVLLWLAFEFAKG